MVSDKPVIILETRHGERTGETVYRTTQGTWTQQHGYAATDGSRHGEVKGDRIKVYR